jgi:hypothetical protein
VVLSGVKLLEDATHPGFVVPNDNEEVFHEEADSGQFVYELDVRQTLLIGAHLILAFHNVNALAFQNPVGLMSGLEIKVQNRLMIFLSAIRGGIVVVVLLEILVPIMGRAARAVHVGGIKNHNIQRPGAVGQRPGVNPLIQIRWVELELLNVNALPEDPFAVGHIGDLGPGGNVEPYHLWEHFVICPDVGRKDQLVGCDSTGNPARLLWFQCGFHQVLS